jgi:Flp pilus assembly protein TadD
MNAEPPTPPARPNRAIFAAFAALALFNLAFGAALFFKGKNTEPSLPPSPEAEALAAAAPPAFNPASSPDHARASRVPSLFRQLDRTHRFNAVVLDGDPALHRELAVALREDPGWHLARVDHAAMVFLRGTNARWTPALLEPLAAAWNSRPAEERALLHAALSARLLALGELRLAIAHADAAIEAEPRSPEAHTQRAACAINAARWEEALDHARRATKAEPSHEPARRAEAQALHALGKFDEAHAITSELLRKNPDDPALLFLHARLAHAAKDYSDEIAALRNLVALAGRQELPAAGYRIYLAQALAKRGTADDARHALAEFARALASDDLGADQRRFAEEATARLKNLFPDLAP